MTQAQQSALEALIGRSLTLTEITAIDPLLDPNNRNDVAIAAILSDGRTRLQSKKIGNGDVLDTVGLTAGNALLDIVYTNELYRHVRSELDRGDLDVSRQIVRQSLDFIATDSTVDGFEQSHADAIKALAVVPNPIHFNQVSKALNLAEDRMVML